MSEPRQWAIDAAIYDHADGNLWERKDGEEWVMVCHGIAGPIDLTPAERAAVIERIKEQP